MFLVEEFVEKLEGVCPSREKLESLDLPESVIEEVIGWYYLPLRNTNYSVTILDDFLNDFFSKYDSSGLEIGMISFSGNLEYFETITIIGKCEADSLVFDNVTQEVFVEEYGTNHILWKCGKSPSMFFKALLRFQEYTSQCLVDESLYENEDKANSCAKKCAYLAGGLEYLPFYAMLLGV